MRRQLAMTQISLARTRHNAGRTEREVNRLHDPINNEVDGRECLFEDLESSFDVTRLFLERRPNEKRSPLGISQWTLRRAIHARVPGGE